MSIKHAWIVFCAALAVALPVRLYQLLALLDEDTGFLNGGAVSTVVLVAVMLAAFMACLIISAKSEDTPVRYAPLQNAPCAVLSGLTGVLILFDSIQSIFANNRRLAEAVNAEKNIMPIYVVGIFLAVVGVAAAVSLLLTAYGFGTGGNPMGKHPLVALLPSIWGCVSLVYLFISYTAVVNVSENVYDIFLFAQSKLFAGIEGRKSGRLLYGMGLPAILLSLVTSVPTLLMAVMGRTVPGLLSNSMHLVNLAMAGYMAAFLLAARHLPQGAWSLSAAAETLKEEE